MPWWCVQSAMDEPELFTFDGFPPALEPIAAKIEVAMRKDADYTELVVRWLADAGIAASGDPHEDARVFAVLMAREPQSDPEKAMTAMGELVGVMALTGIGIVGIFDPTPISDGAGTVVALGMMRYSGWYFVDAALSAVSMVPYLGDAAGKSVLLPRLAARVAKILSTLEKFTAGTGQHVRVAIEAMRRGQRVPKLPRGVVSVAVAFAKTGSKTLDDVLDALRRMPDVPYAKMDQFKAYMKKRGVAVYDGEVGAKALDKMGAKEGAGCFVVLRDREGATRTAFIFRGTPNRSVVHHELWHRNDFLRNHAGSLDRWGEATRSIDKERYVHQRMTGSGSQGAARGQTRWNEYPANERANQALYIEKLERDHELQEMVEQLAALGVKL